MGRGGRTGTLEGGPRVSRPAQKIPWKSLPSHHGERFEIVCRILEQDPIRGRLALGNITAALIWEYEEGEQEILREALEEEIAAIESALPGDTRSLYARYNILRWKSSLEWLDAQESSPAIDNLRQWLLNENGPRETWEERIFGRDAEKQLRIIEGVRAALADPRFLRVANSALEREAEHRRLARVGDQSEAPILLLPHSGWGLPETPEEEMIMDGPGSAGGYSWYATGNNPGFCQVYPEFCLRMTEGDEEEAGRLLSHVLLHELIHTRQSLDWCNPEALEGMMSQDRESFRGQARRQERLLFELHEGITEALALERGGMEDIARTHNPAYWNFVCGVRQILHRAGIQSQEEFLERAQGLSPDVLVDELDRALRPRTGRGFFAHWLHLTEPVDSFSWSM